MENIINNDDGAVKQIYMFSVEDDELLGSVTRYYQDRDVAYKNILEMVQDIKTTSDAAIKVAEKYLSKYLISFIREDSLILSN
jgi:hypothetical protein